MGQDDFSYDFDPMPRAERAFGPDDVGPAKGTPGIDLSVENPFLSIWTRPRATIRGIVDTNPSHYVILLAALAGVINTLSRAATKNLGDMLPLAGVLAVCVPLGLFFGVIGVYVFGMFLKWTGSWLGGRASYEEVRAALAWGNVPIVASAAILIPELIIYGNDLFTTKTPRIAASLPLAWLLILLSAVEIVLSIWAVVLGLKCLGEVNGFSAWRALGSITLVMLMIVVPILLFAVAVILVMPR